MVITLTEFMYIVTPNSCIHIMSQIRHVSCRQWHTGAGSAVYSAAHHNLVDAEVLGGRAYETMPYCACQGHHESMPRERI